jgi:antiviral helicase SKI2
MDVDLHQRLLNQIVSPHKDDAVSLLSELGLAGIPSRDQIHQDIEENLLLPNDKLPDHWLSTYQM